MIPLTDFQLKPPEASSGFTLIEVMIVLVIVGILLGIALPSYQNSMEQGRRSEARSALLDAANRQEQYMLDRGSYTLNMMELGFGADPFISEDGQHYSVDAAVCADGNINRCFVLTAAPTASSPQSDDERCTQFVLGSDGSKSAEGSDKLNCW